MATKIVAAIAIMSATVGLQVLVLMYGWGLTPRSWWWILGGGIVGTIVVRAIGERVYKEIFGGRR